jgi:hypothetical protein
LSSFENYTTDYPFSLDLLNRGTLNQSTSSAEIGSKVYLMNATASLSYRPFGFIKGTFMSVSIAIALMPAVVCGQGAPPNDLFAQATELVGSNVTALGSNIGAAKEPGEPQTIGTSRGRNGGKSVWWSWTAPVAGTVTVDTIGSSFDTVLGVYQGDSLASLIAVGTDDDSGGSGSSKVEFSASQGTIYRILVDGYNEGISGVSGESGPTTNYVNACEGDVALHITPGLLASVTTHPKSTSVAIGANVNLSVGARGASGYQWFKDSVGLDGATNATLIVTNAQLGDAGTYYVLVSNAFSSAVSSNAVLAVGTPVVTQQPESQLAAAGYSATFTVKAAGVSALLYQWKKGSIELAGATSTGLALTNVQMSDAGVYTVLVSDGVGSVVSSNAVLTVIPPYTFGTVAGKPGMQGAVDGPVSSARFSHPCGIAVDSGGNLYVTEWSTNQTIRKITPDGLVSTVAGLTGNSGTNDGFGSEARFYYPEGIAVDQWTNLYVADNFNHTIRKISPSSDGTNWIVSTLAGVPGFPGWLDGDAHAALFRQPSGVTVDAVGNVFVAEWRNNAIRRIGTNGIVRTLAGSKAALSRPDSVAIDASGDLVVLCEDLNYFLRINPGGIASRFGGQTQGTYGAAMDSHGNLYVASSIFDPSWVRMTTSSGQVTRIAGAGPAGFADGSGNEARFGGGQSRPVIDPSGNVYIADNMNHVIRKGVPFAVTGLARDQGLLSGTPAELSVTTSGGTNFTYNWFLNGILLDDSTNSTLEIGVLIRTNSGVYSVVVNNGQGNSVQLNSTARALVPPVILDQQTTEAGAFRLLFRDSDGGLPYDLSKVAVQWCTNFVEATNLDWITLSSRISLTNGLLTVDDTNAPTRSASVYGVLEW